MSLIVILRNTTDLAEVSNYDYEVLVGDGTRERSHTITKGVIVGHKRSDGWAPLVQRVLDKEQKSRMPIPAPHDAGGL